MRPLLRPGLAVAWRTPGSLHLGVDHPSPVILSGLSEACQAALTLMDGTRRLDEIVEQLAGCSSGEVHDLVDQLLAVGAVIDAGRWPGGRGVSADRRERLLPDLMASAPVDPELWWRSLARTHVTVVGASRLGAITARALAASGIGWVTVDDNRPVASADVALGGFSPSDVGSSRADLLASHPGPPAPRSRREVDRRLVVITDAVDVDAHARALTATGATYLVVGCRERSGWIGPLVEPGRSACHFCVELHRRDLDPAWPDVWRQRTWDSSPVTLANAAAVTAHVTAAQVVGWALGEAVPSMSGRLAVDAGGAVTDLHPMPPHPECGCTWQPLAS